MDKEYSMETMLAHYGEDRSQYQGAVVPPIYQNTLFTFESWDAIDDAFADPINNNIYTRGNNPSVSIPEAKLAALSGGEKARLFSSGMAAITAAIMHCVKADDHIITLKNIYGPAMNFIDNYLSKKMAITASFISGDSVSEIEAVITEKTSLIYLESPASSVFTLQDIEAIANLAKKHGIKTIIDNTWATPIFQKPLKLGIDLEVHSCSKYIGGHSDVIAGVIIGNAKDLDEIYMTEYSLFGGKIAPMEAWLLTRSLRTLPLRMARHQDNAMKVSQFLNNHPKVKRVMYPGMEDFPQKELARKQMTGFTGLMGFEIDTDDADSLKAFMNSLNLFCIGVSWGGHESIVNVTAISYLREMTVEQFKNTGLSLGVVRISVGLEDPEDLILDLEQALEHI